MNLCLINEMYIMLNDNDKKNIAVPEEKVREEERGADRRGKVRFPYSVVVLQQDNGIRWLQLYFI